jgi:hypothetical protein
LVAEEAQNDVSKIDQEFISISSNWNQFRDLISKPESQGGESEYEKSVRSKLIEITNAPHQSLKDAAAKDHSARIQAITNAKNFAPVINIWTEEWRRAIELRKIQAEVQITGDADLSEELGKNLQNSINIRQSQLNLLQHNQNYLTVNEKVKRRTQHITDLKNKNKNQAQMIEHLKKQLAEAQKKPTPKPKAKAPAKKTPAKKATQQKATPKAKTPVKK